MKALVYRICNSESVDYCKARPLSIDKPGFLVRVADGRVTFDMKQHYATGKDARTAVEPFIRNWEFDASLQRQPGCFRLEFERAEVIDRRPTAGEIIVNPSPIRLHLEVSVAMGTVYPGNYPSPPPELNSIDSSPSVVQRMYLRYERYWQDKEPLTTMAYYNVTELERSAVANESGAVAAGKHKKDKKGARVLAAEMYKIDKPVLDEIARLSSIKGGDEARKAGGANKPLSEGERRFLKRAAVRLIRRVAEYHSGRRDLSSISIERINRGT